MSMDRFVARQPIFDRRSAVVGYELLFRSGVQNYFQPVDGTYATSRVIDDSLHVFGLDELIAGTRAYVNVGRKVLAQGLVHLLPPERTTVEILEDVPPEPDVIDACRALKARGYELALDDFVFKEGYEPLIAIADVIKVDLRQTVGGERKAVLERHRRPGLRFLAEKVETAAEHVEAAELGYTLFQGYFFCRPEMIQAKEVPPSKMSRLRLAQVVMEPTFDFDRVEPLVRADAALSIKLLRYLNSAGMGVRCKVTSIRQAMLLLGERPLRRWIALVAVASLSEDRTPQLMVTALVRAAFCEHVGLRSKPVAQEGEPFLLGLLSLVDAMIGRPMDEVLSTLAVADRVRAGLLGAGELAGMLRMATAYEAGDWPAVTREARRYGLDEASVAQAYAGALASGAGTWLA